MGEAEVVEDVVLTPHPNRPPPLGAGTRAPNTINFSFAESSALCSLVRWMERAWRGLASRA